MTVNSLLPRFHASPCTFRDDMAVEATVVFIVLLFAAATWLSHRTTIRNAGPPRALARQLDLIDELLQGANLSLADATLQALGRSVCEDDLLVDDASIVIIFLRGLPQPISGRGRARPPQGDDSNSQ